MPKKRRISKKKTAKKTTLPEAALFLGLGAASMAKDPFDDFISYFMKQGKMAVKDQAKLRKEMKKRGEKEYKAMVRGMDKSMNAVLKAMDIPSRKEFEALKRKVEHKKPAKKRKVTKKRTKATKRKRK